MIYIRRFDDFTNKTPRLSMDWSTDMTVKSSSDPTLKELIFELSDTGESKFCFAVCDDEELRREMTEVIAAELLQQGIQTTVFDYQSRTRNNRQIDIVEFLLSRLRASTRQIVIISGLARLNRRTLGRILSELNFKRDILIERRIPILFWVSDSLLRDIVSKAPDFWSRRSATFYFTRSPVKDLLARLFGKNERRSTANANNGRISSVLQKIFSAERELNLLLHSSKPPSPLVIDKLVREIKFAVQSLISECERNSSFLITYTLWKLTRVDQWLYHTFSRSTGDLHSKFREMYDERMDMILDVSNRIVRILKGYSTSLIELAAKRKEIQLLHYFDQFVSHQVERMYTRIERDVELEESTDPSDLEEMYAIGHEIEEENRAAAVREIKKWLESEDTLRPALFSKEEENLLRLLYRGSRNVHEIAKMLEVSTRTVDKRIQNLKVKLWAFFGLNPIS